MTCDQFPDVFEPTPPSASKDLIASIASKNAERQTLYTAVRYLLVKRFNYAGTLPPATTDLDQRGKDADFPFFLSIYGMLLSDSFNDPTLGKRIFSSDDITDFDNGVVINIARRFVDQVVSLVAEYQASEPMFRNVYSTLRELGTTSASSNGSGGSSTGTGGSTTGTGGSTTGTGGSTGTGTTGTGGSTGTGTGGSSSTKTTVFAQQLAEVTRHLVEESAKADDPQLKVRVISLLSVILGDGINGRASAIDVDLPDLEEETQASVLADNVKALAAVYFAAMLEEYKVFDVANTVADQFMQGILPLSRGPGGNAIYEYIRDTPNRFTAVERRTIYAQTLGLAQGSVEVQLPNREFSDLWIRFLSTASLFSRQTLPPTTNSRLVTTGALVTNEQLFKTAKDLAVNLSLHGYGIGYFAAVELQKLIRVVKAMLSFPEVIAAYGVRDVWQLVERVSQLYLGGSVNGVRQRTMAHHGAKIIEFLANKAPILGGPFSPDELKIEGIKTNVEQWLAVTGTDDNVVDKYSAPVAVSQQPTIPMTFGAGQGADFVRNALQQVGGFNPGIQLPNLGMSTNGIAKA